MSEPRLFDSSDQAGWVIVVGWEDFQHYTDRNPIWIKTYLDLLDRDDYLDLSAGSRALLHGLWLMTAKRHGKSRLSSSKSHAEIRADPAKLSRALNLRVRKDHLASLVHAGFIEISASKPVSKPEHPASNPLARAREEVEREVEEETPLPPSGAAKSKSRTARSNGQPEEPSPYAVHGSEPRLKAAEVWVENGLLALVPPEDRRRVLAEEFHISEDDIERLVAKVPA